MIQFQFFRGQTRHLLYRLLFFSGFYRKCDFCQTPSNLSKSSTPPVVFLIQPTLVQAAIL